jgi:hypothetical protein
MKTDTVIIHKATLTVVFCRRGTYPKLTAHHFRSKSPGESQWRSSLLTDPKAGADIANLRNFYSFVFNDPVVGRLSDKKVLEGLIQATADGRIDAYELTDRDKSFLDRYFKPVSESSALYDVDPVLVLGLASESSFADPTVELNTFARTGDAFGLTYGGTDHMTTASSPTENVNQFFTMWGKQIRGSKDNATTFLNGLQGEDATGKKVPGWRRYNPHDEVWRTARLQGIDQMSRDVPLYQMIVPPPPKTIKNKP